jgi:hypothetical protein
LYLFPNKRRRIAKDLWFDGSGWFDERPTEPMKPAGEQT